MRFAKNSNNSEGFCNRGFTLAEVLAALLFMAIVIPMAVQALRIASLAGEVAQRKTEAARVAERVLNESVATTNWNASQVGTVIEETRQYRWALHNEVWNQPNTNLLASGSASSGQLAGGQPQVNQFTANQVTMNLLSVEVTYAVQDRDYSVRLSTLVNSSQ